MADFPPGSVLLEIRGIYDGWSAVLLPDGTVQNRWPVGDYRHQPTQEWIERNGETVAQAMKGDTP